MDFTIDPEYLCSVHIRKEWNQYTQDGREPTPEELLLVLQGKGTYSMSSTDDHPEFAKLREHLGELGYISIYRQCWNGDRVEKPFTLNGVKFKVGQQFSCGAAMGAHFAVRAKHPELYKEIDNDETMD